MRECRACWALCRLTSWSKCGPLPLLPLTSSQHSVFLYIFAEHLTHATYHQNLVLELRREEEYHFLQTQIMTGRGSGNGGGISSLSHGGNGTVLVGILERDVGGYDGGNRVMVMEKRSAGGDGGNGNSGIVVV